MGGGAGPVRKEISLEEYQKNNSNVMTVTTNPDGSKTYTFVDDATIPENIVITFDKNDKLVINDGVTVIVEGNFDIKQETNGIKRIIINGSLKLSGTYEFGNITNGGTGVEVNSPNSLIIESDSFSRVIMNDISNESTGLSITRNGKLENGGTIKGTTVSDNSRGIVAFGNIELKRNSLTEFETISDNSVGLSYISYLDSELIQNGTFFLNEVLQNSIGIRNFGNYILNDGLISMSSISDESIGIKHTVEEEEDLGGFFTQKENTTISLSVFTDSTGILNNSKNTFITLGNIIIKSSDDEDESTKGIECSLDGSIIQNINGSVAVLGKGFLAQYTNDGQSEIEPSPIFNTKSDSDNTIFKGTTYYSNSNISLENYYNLINNDTILDKTNNDYTFKSDHTINKYYNIEFGDSDTLTINSGIPVTLQGKFLIPETKDMTRITNNGTFELKTESSCDKAEIIFDKIYRTNNSTFDAIGINNAGSFNNNATFKQNGNIMFKGIDSNNSNNFIKAYGIKIDDSSSYNITSGNKIIFRNIQNKGVGIDLTSSSFFTVDNSSSIKLDAINGPIDATGINLDSMGVVFINNGTVDFGTNDNPLTLPYSIGGSLVNPTKSDAFKSGTGTYVGY